VATVANHALAVAVGLAVADLVAPGTLRWLLAASFIAVGLWMLKPDQAEDSGIAERSRWGVFGITVVAFFLAEMGDKTQLATVMLAAHYAAPLAVGLGTTLGMLLANAPVVWARGCCAACRWPGCTGWLPQCSSPWAWPSPGDSARSPPLAH
jgi:Ca2+/H+ antiporter, TMEM165/GDT1 family